MNTFATFMVQRQCWCW